MEFWMLYTWICGDHVRGMAILLRSWWQIAMTPTR